MKTYNINDSTIIMGSAREIKSLERNIFKKTTYVPVFPDTPRFNMSRTYGIVIGDFNNNYFIISEHECLRVLMEEV